VPQQGLLLAEQRAEDSGGQPIAWNIRASSARRPRTPSSIRILLQLRGGDSRRVLGKGDAPRRAGLPVHTAWDIGVDDAMAIPQRPQTLRSLYPKLVFRLVWRGSIAGIDCVRGVADEGEGLPDHNATSASVRQSHTASSMNVLCPDKRDWVPQPVFTCQSVGAQAPKAHSPPPASAPTGEAQPPLEDRPDRNGISGTLANDLSEVTISTSRRETCASMTAAASSSPSIRRRSAARKSPRRAATSRSKAFRQSFIQAVKQMDPMDDRARPQPCQEHAGHGSDDGAATEMRKANTIIAETET
jgi:hypothetical protein